MTVFVVGAGLAGLSAAVSLAAQGAKVEVLEAALQAGGRCRSYVDPVLGVTIDNGNHLVLAGNHATFAYLKAIGAEHRLTGPQAAEFPFVDVRDGMRWSVRPSAGPIPWWLLDKARRVPGARAEEYLALARLLFAAPGRTIGEVIPRRGALWERLMEPVLLAALNTRPQDGSAGLAAAVLRETLARGGRACAPRIATPSLSAAFIDPAAAFLAIRGATLRLGARVRALETVDRGVVALHVGETVRRVGARDTVILATPPWIAAELLPGLAAPDRFSPIVNGHFRLAPPAGTPAMVGIVGGAAQWVFAFEGRLSVTVSGADLLVDESRESLAERFWRDIATVHGLPAKTPPWQIVKERRATFAATPQQEARRPAARTRIGNLFLAGDWTATGLPATIEGAIRSGARAADLALKSLRDA